MENFTSIYLFWFSILLFGKLQTIYIYKYIKIRFQFFYVNNSNRIFAQIFIYDKFSCRNLRTCKSFFFFFLSLSIFRSRSPAFIQSWIFIRQSRKKSSNVNHRLTDSRPSSHVYPTKYTHSDTYFSNSIIGPKNQPTFQPEESNKPTPLSSSIDINNSLESHLNFEYPIASNRERNGGRKSCCAEWIMNIRKERFKALWNNFADIDG